MPYVTSVERIGIKKGLEQGLALGRQEGLREGRQVGEREGLLRGIATLLEVRFAAEGVDLVNEVGRISDNSRLSAMLDAIKSAKSLDEVRQALV